MQSIGLKILRKKKNKKFIVCDVVNFYPTISEELLRNSLIWARQYVEISDEEIEIILKAKRSLLFKDDAPWSKKGTTNFDVGQGSWDGAETCEIAGLYILSELSEIPRLNVGLYRDDCLSETNASPRQTEIIKKKICQIFSKHGLDTTAEANKKIVNFLDVTFDLENETFSPYMKPNNTPRYVHKLSNHPPNVTKNIPASVNRRLSSISSSELMFETAAPAYKEALANSGYDFELKFDPNAAEQPKKSRCRKRNISWFNPPYNASVRTNVGAEFLKLLDTSFPKNHPLYKICNRNTVKISYSCTANMEQIISSRNSKILSPPNSDDRSCSCPKNATCPLDGKCLSDNIVYQTTVKTNTQTDTYIGLCSTDFKKRLAVHKHSFISEDNQTSLSKHIKKLKNRNIDYELSWKLVTKAKPFSPVSGICNLCIKEKFYILFHPEMATLNDRNEIYTNCRHKKPVLLVKKNRERKEITRDLTKTKT